MDEGGASGASRAVRGGGGTVRRVHSAATTIVGKGATTGFQLATSGKVPGGVGL